MCCDIEVESFLSLKMKATIENYDNKGVSDAWDHLQSSVRLSDSLLHYTLYHHLPLTFLRSFVMLAFE